MPALCWSLLCGHLAGLKPKFVDIDPKTLNVDADYLISKISKKTKLIMLVNVLGSSSDLKKYQIMQKKKIILIEDNCESLGAKQKINLELSEFWNFSFYYSHQITSGGMILCNSKKDYEILIGLRSHGWSRGMFQSKISKLNPNLDPRFIFYNSGFNLRPLDVQAAIGLSQFKRFSKIRNTRNYNRDNY